MAFPLKCAYGIGLSLVCLALAVGQPADDVQADYQQRVDALLLEQDYAAAILLMEQFNILYPDSTHFDRQLETTKDLLYIQQLDAEQPLPPPAPSPTLTEESSPSSPRLKLTFDGGLKAYTDPNNRVLANYLLSTFFEFFPLRNARDLGVQLSYSGSVIPFEQAGRLVSNLLAMQLQPRFSFFANTRSQLELTIPVGLGLLLLPYVPDSNLLVLSLGGVLYDNLLYHAFSWEPAEFLYFSLGFAVYFAPDQPTYGSQFVELAITEKKERLEWGLVYLIQNQRWGDEQTAIHHLLLRIGYTI